MEVRHLVAGVTVACGPGTTLRAAAQQLATYDIGALPVIEKGELLGIFTERDLAKSIADGHGPDTTPVRSAMTASPDIVQGDMDAKEVANWMLASGYRHIPVFEGTEMIGIASIKDVLWDVTEPEASVSDG